MKLTPTLVKQISEHLQGFRITLNINSKGYKYSCISKVLINISDKKYCETIEEAELLLLNRFKTVLSIQLEQYTEIAQRYENRDNNGYYLQKLKYITNTIKILETCLKDTKI